MEKASLLVILTVFISCNKDDTEKRLIWADEFDYSGIPDTTKWDYDLGDGCPNVCGWGNNELEYYTKSPENVRVESGILVIEAHKNEVGGKPYTSARIVSRGKGDWTYGRFEIKAKLPGGRGTWPAIWMLPTDWKYGGWPSSGEIDIMEHVGYEPSLVHGTIHTETYNHKNQTHKGQSIQVVYAETEFHIYAIEWTEQSISFLVDNKLYYKVSKEAGDTFKEWPFDQRFHLIMNIAVGGSWGGTEGVDESIWPQRMEIDYVRVYQ
jgi:beta-glucanase (GH16 family)